MWVVLLARAVFFCFSFVFRVYVVFVSLLFGCHYQSNRLPVKTHLRNDCYVLSGALNHTYSVTDLLVKLT